MKVTRGKVVLKLAEAEEFSQTGFHLNDVGNFERWAEVYMIGDHYKDAPEYRVGHKVLVPSMGGKKVALDGHTCMIFLQSEIDIYEDN